LPSSCPEGYDVTIFDLSKIGGVMRDGFPTSDCPKTILERYRKKLIEMGKKIRPNSVIASPSP
jgi:glutamate synthase (NADPH/NADH) small chain